MKAKRTRVLIVDDHAIVRAGLAAVLGFEHDIDVVGEASNGEEAVLRATETHPDVVVMDLVMPKMDGAQLAEAMSKDNRLSDIPIVAVTADVDVGSTFDISLFAKVLAKPVTTEKLQSLFGEI